ncbi:hypothetical protein J4447_02515 [Candidatus Pacearchaeota archaeon]|nr:hypothetical protein [Candidatus Pacearchaeota archaeon]
MDITFKCPQCKSSLFFVEPSGKNEYFVKCGKIKECGWAMKVREIIGNRKVKIRKYKDYVEGHDPITILEQMGAI